MGVTPLVDHRMHGGEFQDTILFDVCIQNVLQDLAVKMETILLRELGKGTPDTHFIQHAKPTPGQVRGA